MDKADGFILTLLILLVCIVSGGVYELCREGTTYVTYPIYKATLPFGVIQVKGNFVWGTGGIYGEEYYYIKYMDGNELKSLSLKASETPLKVDGTFGVEINLSKTYCIVHIPKLPEENQTWTTDWILPK